MLQKERYSSPLLNRVFCGPPVSAAAVQFLASRLLVLEIHAEFHEMSKHSGGDRNRQVFKERAGGWCYMERSKLLIAICLICFGFRGSNLSSKR